MAERTLTVKIVGDSRSLERAFNRSERSAKGFQAQVVGVNRGMGGLAKATGATLGLGVFFRGVSRATQAASDLNEEVSKSEQVFGRSAGEVLAWSKTTTNAFGISQRAALSASSGFGQMLETAGLTDATAARMSRTLTELGGDLSSFNNISTDEALEKLRSGLAGEAEPLRVLGVQLSEAAVQQEAYATGIAKVGAKLTEGEKVRARYLLILKQTAKAQGDNARTGDQLAGQQRRLAAAAEDAEASAGGRLLPTIRDLTTIAVAAVDATKKLNKEQDKSNSGGGWRSLDKLRDVASWATTAKWIHATANAIRDLRGEAARPIVVQFDTSKLLTAGLTPGGRKTPGFGEPGFKPGGAPPVPVIPPEQINRIFDEKIARELFRSADDTLPNQIKALDRIEAQLTTEIARVKDVTRKQNLRDQLITAQRQETAVRAQIAQNQQEARLLATEKQRERIEREREAAARRLAAIKSRQFRQLGLAADGSEVVPGVRNLRQQLGNFQAAVEGTFLDTRKTESVLNRIRKVLSGGLGAVSRDVRETIAGMLADLRQQLKDNEGQLTRGRAVSSNAILSGLGLDRDTRKQLEARLARVGAGGKFLPGAGGGAPAAFGAALFPASVIHNTIELDGQKIGASTTRVQQKRKRRQSSQTTGPFAGQ